MKTFIGLLVLGISGCAYPGGISYESDSGQEMELWRLHDDIQRQAAQEQNRYDQDQISRTINRLND